MLIRTQDQLAIVDAVEIHVNHELGKKKFHLCAKYAGAAQNSAYYDILLATYTSKDEAKGELDEIFNYFSEHPNGIYQIRSQNILNEKEEK